MKLRNLTLTAIVATLLAAPAFAQTPPASPTPDPAREAAFVKADVNKDGKLDKAEFTAMLPEQMKANADAIFARRDADKDGFISKAEMMAPMQRPAQ